MHGRRKWQPTPVPVCVPLGSCSLQVVVTTSSGAAHTRGGPRVLLKGGPGNRGRSACGPTHVARLELPRVPSAFHLDSRKSLLIELSGLVSYRSSPLSPHSLRPPQAEMCRSLVSGHMHASYNLDHCLSLRCRFWIKCSHPSCGLRVISLRSLLCPPIALLNTDIYPFYS